MKLTICKCLILCAISCAATLSAAQEFELRHQGIPHDSLYDVCFTAESGIAVGNHGVLLLSQDAGQTWGVDSTFSFEQALLGVTCSSDKQLAVGQQGAIFVRENGQWRKANPVTEERLFSAAIRDDGFGIAVGSFGIVLRTLDGGGSWEKVSIDWEKILSDFFEPHIYDVSIDSRGLITIVGEFELILQSVDNAETWAVAHRGDASLFALHLPDSGKGFAVGQDGRILRTLDGGASWSEVDANVTNNLLGVWSSSQEEVLITGIRNMLRSSDGGETWSRSANERVLTGWYQGIGVVEKEVEVPNGRFTQEAVFVVGQSGDVLRVY